MVISLRKEIGAYNGIASLTKKLLGTIGFFSIRMGIRKSFEHRTENLQKNDKSKVRFRGQK